MLRLATRKLFGFRGGIHPSERKDAASQPIDDPPHVRRLYLPLRQHAGAAATPMVSVGQKVLGGERLATTFETVAAPVHAPTSGTIVEIGEHAAPHPSGMTCPVIVLEVDGLDEWGPTPEPFDPFTLDPEDLARRIEEAGVVGMGGAAFPSAVKLRQSANRVDTLVMNGAECEPFLSCDDRLMRERAEEIVDGIRLMQYALGGPHAIVGIEDNKPAAAHAMSDAAAAFDDLDVVVVPTRFPTGSGKQLIRILTGREVPAGGRSHDAGVIIHNVATAYAVSDAIRNGRPLVKRVITVAGGAIAVPRNIEVLIGTPAQAVIEACGGLNQTAARIVLGGPMTGHVLTSTQAPIVKGTGGVLALTADEVHGDATGPCIRCARCVDACPMGLVPLEMAAASKVDDFDGALDFGLKDCILCGSCAYVCPSHIPLVHYFQYGKGQLAERRADDKRATLLKQRTQDRIDRVEKEKREKAEAAKKAAEKRRAAKKKKEAAKAAKGAQS